MENVTIKDLEAQVKEYVVKMQKVLTKETLLSGEERRTWYWKMFILSTINQDHEEFFKILWFQSFDNSNNSPISDDAIEEVTKNGLEKFAKHHLKTDKLKVIGASKDNKILMSVPKDMLDNPIFSKPVFENWEVKGGL